MYIKELIAELQKCQAWFDEGGITRDIDVWFDEDPEPGSAYGSPVMKAILSPDDFGRFNVLLTDDPCYFERNHPGCVPVTWEAQTRTIEQEEARVTKN